MTQYNFDKKTITPHYEVLVATSDAYGCFENHKVGGEGGLWFERLEGGVLALIDYDGVYELHPEVKTALRDMGIVVDEDF